MCVCVSLCVCVCVSVKRYALSQKVVLITATICLQCLWGSLSLSLSLSLCLLLLTHTHTSHTHHTQTTTTHSLYTRIIVYIERQTTKKGAKTTEKHRNLESGERTGEE